MNLLTQRIKLNLVLQLLYLNSNFALTLGDLTQAFNNPALVGFPILVTCELGEIV